MNFIRSKLGRIGIRDVFRESDPGFFFEGWVRIRFLFKGWIRIRVFYGQIRIRLFSRMLDPDPVFFEGRIRIQFFFLEGRTGE